MALIDKVKLNIRMSSSTFDADEITPLIAAAKAELRLAGVVNIDDTDALIFRAIVYYCKANFGFDEHADRYAAAFEHLKIAMALSSEYNTATSDDTSDNDNTDSGDVEDGDGDV